ncbi:hypothetical protein [Janthinobacterium sp. HLX7-2]|uniref:hypothetical protein n=1 Tax=Janthinobacterium sp. HLX7-2 TaxID=1259331 RepID=UPI003F260DFC
MMNVAQQTLFLNLDRTGSATRLPVNENWQHGAFRFVRSALNEAMKNARRYAKEWSNRPSPEKRQNELERSYNAIFVNGPRGAGKTAFMINLEMMWRQSEVESVQEFADDADARTTTANTSGLCFLPLIDPTLIRDNEGFDSYLVAQVHQAVRNKLDRPSDDYLRALESLGESLAPTDSSSMGIGIDRILSYQIAQSWEWRFHYFLYLASLELGVTAFVFHIDDIDMSLGRAHGLLETLRRWLACPFSIPLVSGDINLYRQLAEQYFAEHSKHAIDDTYREKLAENYLEKLFPTHLRTRFTSLSLLQPYIQVIQGDPKKGEGIPLSIYLAWMAELVYPLTNGEEGSKPSLLPNTARTLIQLVKLPVRYLEREQEAWSGLAYNEGDKPLSKRHRDIARSAQQFVEAQHGAYRATLLEGWMKYCEAHRNWVGWRIAESETLLAASSGWGVNAPQPLDRPLRELPIFNVERQFSIPEDADHYDFSGECLKQLRMLERRRSSAYIESQKSLLEKKLRTQVPYPALEYFVYLQFVSQTTVKQTYAMLEEDTETSRDEFLRAVMLLNLYTTHEFYGRSGTATRQVFFGKAFELLLDSLLQDYSTASGAHRGGATHIRKILTSAPFHSTYAIFPTKPVEDDDSNEVAASHTTEEKEESANNQADKSGNWDELYRAQNWLNTEVKKWQVENAKVLKQVRQRGLLHLLYFVFNKTFNQINALKAGPALLNETGSQNTLSHAARRFQMIVINAVASFLKPNHLMVVQQNVATGPHIDLDPAKWDSDRSWQINVRGLGKQKQTDERAALIMALQTHPVFNLVDPDRRGLFLIGPQKRNSSDLKPERDGASPSVTAPLKNVVATLLDSAGLSTRTRRPGITRLLKTLMAIPKWESLTLDVAPVYFNELTLLLHKAQKYAVPDAHKLEQVLAQTPVRD